MQQEIQKFGRALSAMVMPNIGAFIAWGLITAIFIDSGWWPNKHIAQLVSPMLKYLLPLLIAYTAGKNVAGLRGGVIGAVASMGIIIGSDIPMFMGAMVMGPLAGWCIKRFDRLVEGKVRQGFEMLVDNFSLGIIGMLLAIVGYLFIGGVVSWLVEAASAGVNFLLAQRLSPLLSLVVDPCKVLFLNNAVNHGIMTPLGIEQVSEMGQSMLFLVDPNPGPGLGILLACWVFGRGNTRQSAPGAVVIQLFGGIHEIYFPYVLAKPVLLLAVIGGNICALLFCTLLDIGLVAPASPGSLISIILMAPKGKTILAILAVVVGTVVSFLLSSPMIKHTPDFQGDTDELPHDGPFSLTGSGQAQDGLATDVGLQAGTVRKIVFSCDAGMGSSALGATTFRKRLQQAGIPIEVINTAVNDIPSDADVVVCQQVLSERAAQRVASMGGHAQIVNIRNFLKDAALDGLFAHLRDNACLVPGWTVCGNTGERIILPTPPKDMLQSDGVILGLPSESKEEAIRRAGECLVALGYVDGAYADSMLERERLATTYMGMGLAIPHGTSEAKASVRSSGIVVLQYPESVDFDGEKARLVIGIAGVGDAHLEMLSHIAEVLEDEAVMEQFCTTNDKQQIIDRLR
ncbi:MAG: PTS mannitol transporter subunit IICBA [Bacteroidales bacterium]|nr:PTS mannitol transporter subunit IICBA [Bacteroidales bacterium]